MGSKGYGAAIDAAAMSQRISRGRSTGKWRAGLNNNPSVPLSRCRYQAYEAWINCTKVVIVSPGQGLVSQQHRRGEGFMFLVGSLIGIPQSGARRSD
jgi:hypothetical protein